MIEIVKIEKLKPLEKVFPNHLKNLSKMIFENNVIQTPIIADQKPELSWMAVIVMFSFFNMGIKKFQ